MPRPLLPSLIGPDRMPSLLGRDGDPFAALRQQMDEVFDAFMGASALAPLAGGNGAMAFAPRIDVSETDKELRITVDLPGLEEKDVEVKLAGDQLTIRGEKRAEHQETGGGKGTERHYHRIERSYGAFQRTIVLPFDAEADKVEAAFKNGVLTVTLPKPAQMQQQAKKIEVRKAA